mgnify:CR=1 FL=1
MQLEEILEKLENNTGEFPRQALEKAIEEKEVIAPILLNILSESKNRIEDLYNDFNYILHIYALYLLAQFREQKAYPLIIDFFSVPGDISLDVTGDVVTDDLGRILACVNHGDIKLTKKLIENPEVNEYVKSAAIKSLVISVVQGIIDREEAKECFAEIFSHFFENKSAVNKVENKSYWVWTQLTLNSCRLAPLELQEYIQKAFDEDLIETGQNTYDYFLNNGWENNLNELKDDPHYSLIKNAITEMEPWACFNTNQPLKINNKNSSNKLEGFSSSSKKNKSKTKKKKKIQKESRKINRTKKK